MQRDSERSGGRTPTAVTELQIHVHGMDCAEEAALVRRALGNLRGISHLEFDLINSAVVITFAPADVNADSIVAAVRGTGLPAHPVHDESDRHDHRAHESNVWTIASGVLFAVGWIVEGYSADHWFDVFTGHRHDTRAAVVYALSAIAGLWPLLPRAVAALRHLRLDMHVLVCLTVIGAALIGEWSEGAAVAFLFALAHRMESWSIERARTEIEALVGRGPSLIAHGSHGTANVERWIERFAGIYTPGVAGAALMVAVVPPMFDAEWSLWFYRALVFLVLACPCALVISTPVTMVAALASAARQGVLVKSPAALERAAAAATPTRAALTAVGLSVASANDGRAETADVIVTASDDRAVSFLVQHARRALGVVRQNVAVSLLTKVAFLISAPFGFAPLWMAVLADTGATVLVTLNGLRLLRPHRYQA
jgi:cation transport ATPase